MNWFETQWWEADGWTRKFFFSMHFSHFGEVRPCECPQHRDLRQEVINHGFGIHESQRIWTCIACSPEVNPRLINFDLEHAGSIIYDC